MFSVFFSYLTPLIEANLMNVSEKSSMRELFKEMHDAYQRGLKGLEYCIRIFAPDIQNDEELIEYIHSNTELMQVIRWANRNITLNVENFSYETIGVNIKIVDCMLIKLVEAKKLDKKVYQTLHRNLTDNVYSIKYEINTEDLPF